jgi:hypothetical protein
MTGRAFGGGRRGGLVGDDDDDADDENEAAARDKQWRTDFPGAIHSPTGGAGGKHAK